MGFWYILGIAALVGIVLNILGILKVDEIIGSIVAGFIAAAVIAVILGFFGIDFSPAFQRSAIVLVPLCFLYEIFG
ncbi:MAG: hypothetical protein IKS23_00255 [Alphaproteobacteria bacterium]|nr:hypothetical protein [Alphaproteobacteria bacterium]